MKTALVIEDGLYRRVKVKAAAEGRSVTELVERGMRWVVGDGEVAGGGTGGAAGAGLGAGAGVGCGDVGLLGWKGEREPAGVAPGERDRFWMGQAVAEGERGMGFTSPNPAVGAVVVRDGVAVGRGYHRVAGAPHAEVEAIRDAGAGRCRGATIYVTLEPCSTHGRTPPCCGAIVAAGIERVVYGSTDPNPAHAGAARRVLAEAGIEVESGVGESETGRLIDGFKVRVAEGRPRVVAKIGQSLDGRLTRPPGEGQWLTDVAAREDAHFLRGLSDAVIVGAGTVLADDPALDIRGPAASWFAGKPQPWRVVVAGRRGLPDSLQVMSDCHRDRTLVYRGRSAGEMLAELAVERGCNQVLVEGGGNLIRSFFAAGLVDAVVAYVAPLWCGAGCVPSSGDDPLPGSVELADFQVRPVGRCLRVEARVVRAGRPAHR